jgi:hypothetical protein
MFVAKQKLVTPTPEGLNVCSAMGPDITNPAGVECL